MSSEREAVLKAIKDRLVPFLEQQGFAQRAMPQVEEASVEMQTAFPFGYLERKKRAAVELLEIQMDKRGAARFVFNFGAVPEEGVTLPWGHFDQANVSVSALADAFRLHSQSSWPKWFSIGWFPRDARARAEKVVARAISLYPEIEAWFTARAIGPHLRPFGFPRKTTQEAHSTAV